MTCAVQFKAKPKRMLAPDGALAYEYIDVPLIGARHVVSLQAFRLHRRYGMYANSDVFPSVLRRTVESLCGGHRLRMDKLPACVSVDASGFLATVTVDMEGVL